MLVFIGRDDRRIHRGPSDQLREIGGEKIGVDILRQRSAEVLPDIAQTDPSETRVVLGQHAPDPPDGATADDGQPDFFVLTSHRELFRFHDKFVISLNRT